MRSEQAAAAAAAAAAAEAREQAEALVRERAAAAQRAQAVRERQAAAAAEREAREAREQAEAAAERDRAEAAATAERERLEAERVAAEREVAATAERERVTAERVAAELEAAAVAERERVEAQPMEIDQGAGAPPPREITSAERMDMVQQLVDMEFRRDFAEQALDATNNDLEAAVAWAFQQFQDDPTLAAQAAMYERAGQGGQVTRAEIDARQAEISARQAQVELQMTERARRIANREEAKEQEQRARAAERMRRAEADRLNAQKRAALAQGLREEAAAGASSSQQPAPHRPVEVEVKVPRGLRAGMQFTIPFQGRIVPVFVPQDCKGGDTIVVTISAEDMAAWEEEDLRRAMQQSSVAEQDTETQVPPEPTTQQSEPASDKAGIQTMSHAQYCHHYDEMAAILDSHEELFAAIKVVLLAADGVVIYERDKSAILEATARNVESRTTSGQVEHPGMTAVRLWTGAFNLMNAEGVPLELILDPNNERPFDRPKYCKMINAALRSSSKPLFMAAMSIAKTMSKWCSNGPNEPLAVPLHKHGQTVFECYRGSNLSNKRRNRNHFTQEMTFRTTQFVSASTQSGTAKEYMRKDWRELGFEPYLFVFRFDLQQGSNVWPHVNHIPNMLQRAKVTPDGVDEYLIQPCSVLTVVKSEFSTNLSWDHPHKITLLVHKDNKLSPFGEEWPDLPYLPL
mmetsp:Transcript_2526/g.5226  ORF Transcript_2526/g.5226 Transcript_2526/m.5226 type:complete len:689 (-) Transcript_2526:149-2215(-)